MDAPLVSVCLPNLNTLPHLQERIDTIFAQTYPNWELVVSDNFSQDGAWAFFEELARKDERVSIAQAPREGMYANWNNCLRRARGDYMYIATSDDGMAPDCLQKLVTALEQHKDCELAHCPLVIVDGAGVSMTEPSWPDCTAFGRGMGELLRRPHLRRAPYDGLLHLTGWNAYLSITQLLIRRSLLSRVGGFSSKWGSLGDFNWGMKAGLTANAIHVPDTSATWRFHATQATASVNFLSLDHAQKVEAMIDDAIHACEPYLKPAVIAGLRRHWLGWTRDMRLYNANLRQHRSVIRRRLYQIQQLFSGTAAARSQLLGQLFGMPKSSEVFPRDIRLWLESIGLGPVITA